MSAFYLFLQDIFFMFRETLFVWLQKGVGGECGITLKWFLGKVVCFKKSKLYQILMILDF